MKYLVLLAGGHGTRLWPVSREKNPKQMQTFGKNKKMLIEENIDRVKKGFPLDNIYISTTRNNFLKIKKLSLGVPDKNFIIEPERKDTAAAIGLAAAIINKRDPESIMTVINTDAYVSNKKEYIKVIKLSQKVADREKNSSVLVGVNPTYPETGYGYIKMNRPVEAINNHEVFSVSKFVEKPSVDVATAYLKKWEYLWNPGMFTWPTNYLLDLYKEYLPKTYKNLIKIQGALNTKDEKKTLEKEYSKMQRISIDYAILEKTKNILVIPANFGWADIGHWRNVLDILGRKSDKNMVKGDHIGVDSDGNLIYSLSKRLVTTVGLRGMIIIDTPDAILVCNKNNAQDVKKIVEKIKKRGMKKYL